MSRNRGQRWIAAVLWALCGLAVVANVLAHRRGIPLGAPPAGTTRWVLGSGLLTVEHSFVSTSAADRWPEVDVWIIQSGTWASLVTRSPPRFVGYANVRLFEVTVPLVAVTFAASYPILRAQFSRQRKGPHCLSCGYDLRATPERCPECGEP